MASKLRDQNDQSKG